MHHRKSIHAMAGLLAAISLMAADVARADFPLSDPHPVLDKHGILRLDPQAELEVERHAWSTVAPYVTTRERRIFTWFEIAGTTGFDAPRPGFAPPLAPNKAPLVKSGLLEITPLRWSTGAYFQRGGGFKGTTSLRHSHYRVLAPGRGVVAQAHFLRNAWEWTVMVHGNSLTLDVDSKSRGARFAADNHVRAIVAEIFNVDVRRVSVRAPDMREIDALLRRAR